MDSSNRDIHSGDLLDGVDDPDNPTPMSESESDVSVMDVSSLDSSTSNNDDDDASTDISIDSNE